MSAIVGCQTFNSAIQREGEMMTVLDVLAQDVGILGLYLRLAGDRHVLRQLHGPEIARIRNSATVFARPHPAATEKAACAADSLSAAILVRACSQVTYRVTAAQRSMTWN